MTNSLIELHLNNVDFHLQTDHPAKFTFAGYIFPSELGDQVLAWIRTNPRDCRLKFFIELPEDEKSV